MGNVKKKDVPATVERPLLILTLAFAAGIATGVYISFPAGPLLIAAAFIFAILLVFWRIDSFRGDGPGWLLVGGLLLLVFLIGMAYVTARQSAAQGTVTALGEGPNSQGKEATIEGTIIRDPDVREGRVACITRAQTVNGSPASGLILVVDYHKEAPAFEYGDRISARGRLQRPKAASNPGEFDYAPYLARQGIYATLSIWDGGQLQKSGQSKGNPFIKAAIATKNRLEHVLRQTLPEPHASLLAGLLFGSRGNLPEDLQKAFRDTGVFHILPPSYTRNRERTETSEAQPITPLCFCGAEGVYQAVPLLLTATSILA